MISPEIDETELKKLVEALPDGRELIISKDGDGKILISRVVACEPHIDIEDYWLCTGPDQAASTICISLLEAEKSAQQGAQAELCPICFDDGIGSEKWGGHHPGCPNAKRAQSA